MSELTILAVLGGLTIGGVGTLTVMLLRDRKEKQKQKELAATQRLSGSLHSDVLDRFNRLPPEIPVSGLEIRIRQEVSSGQYTTGTPIHITPGDDIQISGSNSIPIAILHMVSSGRVDIMIPPQPKATLGVDPAVPDSIATSRWKKINRR